MFHSVQYIVTTLTEHVINKNFETLEHSKFKNVVSCPVTGMLMILALFKLIIL